MVLNFATSMSAFLTEFIRIRAWYCFYSFFNFAMFIFLVEFAPYSWPRRVQWVDLLESQLYDYYVFYLICLAEFSEFLSWLYASTGAATGKHSQKSAPLSFYMVILSAS